MPGKRKKKRRGVQCTLLKKYGLSAEQVSARTGIPPTSLSYYMNGRRTINSGRFMKLVTVLKADPKELASELEKAKQTAIRPRKKPVEGT